MTSGTMFERQLIHEIDDSNRLARPHYVWAIILIPVGILFEFSTCMTMRFDEEGLISILISLLILSVIPAVGILHLVAGMLIRRRRVIVIYFGITLTAGWAFLFVAAGIGACIANAWALSFIPAGLMVFPIAHARKLWRARAVFMDEEDWHREGLPAAKGFEPLMVVLSPPSDEAKS